MVAVRIRGGSKLEQALAKIARSVHAKKALEVGFLEGAKYPDGTSVAMVAAIQEFGAPKVGIPPRSFFRKAVKEHAKEWGPTLAEELQATNISVEAALTRLGLVIQGEIQQSIIDIVAPPLSPVTLMVRQIIGPNGRATFADVLEARRRVAAGQAASGVSTKPLIWTAHMLKSVDLRVK